MIYQELKLILLIKQTMTVLEDGFGGKDYVVNVEHIIGSKNDDKLAGFDQVITGIGNTIQGGEGNDTLYYTSGNDRLYGGTINDSTLGNDWISFQNTNIGSTGVSLAEGGSAGNSRLYGINNIIDSTTNTGIETFMEIDN